MSNGTMDIDHCTSWLEGFRERVTAQQPYLTELDSAIGDADHGANMVRGMAAVMDKIAAAPAATVGELFKGVGMTLVTSVGGASGPLYGTFFLRIGMNVGEVAQCDAPTFAAGLRAGLGGLVDRGKAEAGDKTMFDAMAPALDAFDADLASGGDLHSAATAASEAANLGRDATRDLLARKGRASYLGERSIGHIDPGSASTGLLFEALAEATADG
ncbi:dihydroxyacetone kinase subunit DhaL [Demequina aurantiaca]|uniref:dihydroxyacetone kinase subunit DhaL n=1 Tax=Demequina aurantiaca TaxID=676200 RepID=UPI003D339177